MAFKSRGTYVIRFNGKRVGDATTLAKAKAKAVDHAWENRNEAPKRWMVINDEHLGRFDTMSPVEYSIVLDVKPDPALTRDER